MKKEDVEEKALVKSNFFSRIKLRIRNIKRDISNTWTRFKELDKKERLTKILSTRYVILFIFSVIMIKTIIFLFDTVFYKHGIWVWHLRQTAFFVFILIAPMFLFRHSRFRFAYRNDIKLINKYIIVCR